MSARSAPRIGVTLGDPSGVGPEIVARALAAAPSELRHRVDVFGDTGVLVRAAGPLPGVKVVEVTRLAEEDSLPGRPTPAGGAAQVAYLDAALEAARAGALDALVTAPISKTQ